ncbi:co-chaperone GroES [Guggenheimella bovis]
MSIKPLGKRLVLKELEAQETTSSGLVLAGAKEEPQLAEVLAVGEVEGVKVGDKVFYKKYAGTKVHYEKADYLIIDLDDVIAVLQ